MFHVGFLVLAAIAFAAFISEMIPSAPPWEDE